MPKNVEEGTKMSLSELQHFEAGSGIDVTEYEGQKCTLAEPEIIEVKQDYDPETGEKNVEKKFVVRKLKVFSEPLAEVDGPEGKIQIRASDLFNLKLKDGQCGVTPSPKAKINKFLAKLKLPLGLEGVNKIGGQQVTMKVVTNAQGNDWLSFVY